MFRTAVRIPQGSFDWSSGLSPWLPHHRRVAYRLVYRGRYRPGDISLDLVTVESAQVRGAHPIIPVLTEKGLLRRAAAAEICR